jgi:hypothetical protein
MNNKKWFLIALLIIIVGVGAYFIGKDWNNQAQVTSVPAIVDSYQGPTTSAILDKATPPTYSGTDLVMLRQQCAAQAQAGLNNFIQSQNKIDEEFNDATDTATMNMKKFFGNLSEGSYTLDQYHFNETLGTCLIVVDDSLNAGSNNPEDTTYLVNVYENKSIMNCTAYGNPATSRSCYDDQGNPGELVSYEDWTDILNQYMNQ